MKRREFISLIGGAAQSRDADSPDKAAKRAYNPRRRSEDEWMKLALIALGLLATTGVVYAACVFC